MLDVLFLADLIRLTLDGTPFPDLDRALPLLLGTAATESDLTAFRQHGNGPARGLWQMEPATERDHWRWLWGPRPERQALRKAIKDRSGIDGDNVHALEYHLPYQILLARLHYYVRDPQRLPAGHDLAEQARRWKQYYNTPLGAGTEEQYVADWARLVAPVWPPLPRA